MIAILFPLMQEADHFLSKYSWLSDKHCGRYYYRGSAEGKDVMVAVSNWGKVNASQTATTLIEKYQASRIIVAGTAGGVRDVKKGDLVLGDKTVQYDFQVFGINCGQRDYAKHHIACDAALTELVSKAAPGLKLGTILSGDCFLQESPLLPEEYVSTVVDMESAAVSQVCESYEIPHAVIRYVTDLVGSGSQEQDFWKTLNLASMNLGGILTRTLQKLG